MAVQLRPTMTRVAYRTVAVDGVNVFYREAGPRDAPAILLLHGWPSSSHMFRDLIPKLADRFRIVAPDYPGFGYSDAPAPTAFTYTFDHLAEFIGRFLAAVGVDTLTMYIQDYGGPIGMRIATSSPDRIRAIVVQNTNMHLEGIAESLAPLAKYWEDQSSAVETDVRGFLAPATTKFQYTHGVSNPDAINPDAWTVDQAGLDRPGNDLIQLALFLDYRSNPPLYPKWQAYLREHQPPRLVASGKNDPFFLPAGAVAIGRDNPNARVLLLDGGHFALEEHADVIASEMIALEDRVAAAVRRYA
jgi:pimeloyl-ACP methyl ester carboxylesterase